MSHLTYQRRVSCSDSVNMSNKLYRGVNVHTELRQQVFPLLFIHRSIFIDSLTNHSALHSTFSRQTPQHSTTTHS